MWNSNDPEFVNRGSCEPASLCNFGSCGPLVSRKALPHYKSNPLVKAVPIRTNKLITQPPFHYLGEIIMPWVHAVVFVGIFVAIFNMHPFFYTVISTLKKSYDQA